MDSCANDALAGMRCAIGIRRENWRILPFHCMARRNQISNESQKPAAQLALPSGQRNYRCDLSLAADYIPTRGLPGLCSSAIIITSVMCLYHAWTRASATKHQSCKFDF
uniref:Uncharacterized protein n=1 Tax=Odontella aurita TaxID=265563 RepID=A0A7S4IX94_9STRA